MRKFAWLGLSLMLCGCHLCRPQRLVESQARVHQAAAELDEVKESIRDLPMLQAQVRQLRQRRDQLRRRRDALRKRR
ncbi:MAG: hypothetical protein U0931_38860 [Vulcanimicrobiota bacterium]